MAPELINPAVWPRVCAGVRWMKVDGATTMYAAEAPDSPNRTHDSTRFGCQTKAITGMPDNAASGAISRNRTDGRSLVNTKPPAMAPSGVDASSQPALTGPGSMAAARTGPNSAGRKVSAASVADLVRSNTSTDNAILAI